jgi:hypothetical protein
VWSDFGKNFMRMLLMMATQRFNSMVSRNLEESGFTSWILTVDSDLCVVKNVFVRIKISVTQTILNTKAEVIHNELFYVVSDGNTVMLLRTHHLRKLNLKVHKSKFPSSIRTYTMLR